MYYVYIIESDLTQKFYIGYTNNYKLRWNSHKNSCNRGVKTKLYDCMRKYGFDNFEMVLVESFLSKDQAIRFEKKLISQYQTNSLNIALGGEGGFVVPEEKKLLWQKKLSKARQGRKPALGMKHTDENKKIFSESGKKRWDMYGRYPKEVISYSFKDANKLYGISKTHYYRLLKQAKSNDLG